MDGRRPSAIVLLPLFCLVFSPIRNQEALHVNYLHREWNLDKLQESENEGVKRDDYIKESMRVGEKRRLPHSLRNHPLVSKRD